MAYAYLFKYIIIGDTGKWKTPLAFVGSIMSYRTCV